MEICEGSGTYWDIAGERKRGHDPVAHTEGRHGCPVCTALSLAETQSQRADEQRDRADEAEKRAEAVAP